MPTEPKPWPAAPSDLERHPMGMLELSGRGRWRAEERAAALSYAGAKSAPAFMTPDLRHGRHPHRTWSSIRWGMPKLSGGGGRRVKERTVALSYAGAKPAPTFMAPGLSHGRQPHRTWSGIRWGTSELSGEGGWRVEERIAALSCAGAKLASVLVRARRRACHLARPEGLSETPTGAGRASIEVLAGW